MKCIERFEKYRDDDFDRIILLIKNGTIKCGKYSHLVKVDEDKPIKGKTLFESEEKNKDDKG